MLLSEDALTARAGDIQKNNWEASFRNFLYGGASLEETTVPSRDSQIVLSEVFDQSPTGIVIVSPDGRVLLVNRMAEQIFEYDREKTPEITWPEMRAMKRLFDHNEAPLTEELDPLYIAMRQKRRTTSNVLVRASDSDYEEWVSVTAFPVFGTECNVIACVAIVLDITDFKGIQDILYHQATHDSLTGLPNRALFSASLAQAFARAKRGHSGGAVLMLDVDKFKRVNDSLGHAAGDELLVKTANRICSEVRETDVVSRIGGDEFAILLADIQGEENLHIVGDVADRICRSMSEEFSIRGNETYITVSIGISLFPPDGLDEDTLFSKADAAMYQVKANGRNGWRFWEEPKIDD